MLMDWLSKLQSESELVYKEVGSQKPNLSFFKWTTPKLGEEDPLETVKTETLKEMLGFIS